MREGVGVFEMEPRGLLEQGLRYQAVMRRDPFSVFRLGGKGRKGCFRYLRRGKRVRSLG